jgi:biotin carboxyl carrier protein
MTEIFDKVGSLGTTLMLLGGVALLMTLAFGAASAMKKRIPVVAWVAFPIVVAVMGAMGTWIASGGVLVSTGYSPAEQVADIAFIGMWDAIRVDWLGRWIAAGVLLFGTWGAALGAGLAAGPDKLWTWGSALMCLALTAVGTACSVYYATNNGLGQESYMLIGILGFGGVGVAFGATRRALHEHEFRVAGMRFAASCCYFLSIIFAARATVIGSRLHAFASDGLGLGELELAEAIEIWNQFALPVDGIHWMVILFAAAIAWFGFANELGEIVMRYTLLDVMACAALLANLGGVFLIQSGRTGPLFDIGTHGPALEMYSDMGAELPPAVVSVDKQIYEIPMSNSSFGDVFVYRAADMRSAPQAGTVTSVAVGVGAKVKRGDVVATVAPKDPSMGKPMDVTAQYPGIVAEVLANPNDAVEKNVALVKIETGWLRRYERTMFGWNEDDSLLADVEVKANPLLAVASGADATPLVEFLENVPENKALLLMRAAEVKADVEVPADLAQRQVTFLPIELSQERDLKTEAWAVAGERSINWGPVVWFGDNMDEEPMVYSPTVFEQTQATGLHVLVGENARVKGVMASCMPVRVQRQNPDGSDIIYVVPDPEEEEGEEGDKPADAPTDAAAAAPEGEAPAPAPAVAAATPEGVPGEEVEKTAWVFSTSERFCRILGAEKQEFIDEALDVWDVPESEVFRMSLTTSGPFPQEEAQGLIDHQIGAIEWCIEEARDVPGATPETTAGRMTLNGKVRRAGTVSSVTLDEKSKLNNGTIASCIGKRLKTIGFTEIPEPEEVEGEEEVEKEPVEPREFQMVLNIMAEES